MSETKEYEAMSPEEQRRFARRAAWRWGTLVVTFLTLQVGIGVAAIVLSTGDRSVAIEPNYYQKALKWDEHLALQQASDRLRWTAHVVIPPVNDSQGRRSVSIQLLDALGRPVEGLQGTVEVYHHARAGEVQSLDLEPLGRGVYRVSAIIDRDGLWQVELDLHDDGDSRFLNQQTIELHSDAVAADGAAQ